MGYIGIRTTGGSDGYRWERRAYSNRVRRRDDVIESYSGLTEYLNDEGQLPLDFDRHTKPPRRRRHPGGRDLGWKYRFHLALIAKGRPTSGCDHVECLAHRQEIRDQRIDNDRRRKERMATGELQRLLDR